MLVRELLENAIKRARLNPNDAKVFEAAQKALENAIRKYSAQSAVTGFITSQSITLTQGKNTLGRPTPKKGRRMHLSPDTNHLPDLTGYNPETNNFGYIMGRDFFLIAQHPMYKYWAIRQHGEGYEWGSATASDYVDTVPQIIIPELESIAAIVCDGKWFPLSLVEWEANNRPEHTYAVVPGGDGILEVYVPNTFEGVLLYNRTFSIYPEMQLQIPSLQILLLETAVAHTICRTVELKENLGGELSSMLGQCVGTNSNLVLPIWEG